MPCDYRIDGTRQVVFSRGFDVVTEADIMSHKARLGADPDFNPAYAQLFDFSGITDLQVTSTFLQSRAQAGEIFNSDSRRAFVAPQDSVYGNARAFLAWLGDTRTNIRVFREMDEAREWLGLDPD